MSEREMSYRSAKVMLVDDDGDPSRDTSVPIELDASVIVNDDWNECESCGRMNTAIVEVDPGGEHEMLGCAVCFLSDGNLKSIRFVDEEVPLWFPPGFEDGEEDEPKDSPARLSITLVESLDVSSFRKEDRSFAGIVVRSESATDEEGALWSCDHDHGDADLARSCARQEISRIFSSLPEFKTGRSL